MRKTCLEMIYALAKNDPRILFIGSDLGTGTLSEFKKEMPERFFMEGVCEGNIIGMAAGFALNGKIPYVNTIASFLTRRCYEQVVLDLCLHNANVRLVGNGGGMVYAPLGPTHETIEDIAIMRALPRITVIAPADADEMRRVMPKTVDYPGPIYIRLAKGYDPVVTSSETPFEIGKGFLMRKGRDALIVSTGIMLKVALEAAQQLVADGIDAGVLHLPTIKPLDEERLFDLVSKVPVIVTVEEHSVIGGLGSAVAELIAEANFSSGKRFKRMGIPDMFPDEYGSQASLLERFSLTAENVARVIKNMMN